MKTIFDYVDIPKVLISGGKGTGAVAEQNGHSSSSGCVQFGSGSQTVAIGSDDLMLDFYHIINLEIMKGCIWYFWRCALSD